jgi:hypothetical protein
MEEDKLENKIDSERKGITRKQYVSSRSGEITSEQFCSYFDW